jgi:hypothetical protein
MRSTAHEEEPRRGFVRALLGGALLVLIGVYGGWLVVGGAVPGTGRADLLGSASSAKPSSGSEVVQIPVLTTSQSSSSAVQGQAAPASQGNGNGGNAPGHAISVSAVVSGRLGPGSPALLLVTITNPNSQAVEVTSVSGAVTSVTSGTLPGKSACSASWYHVGTFTGSRTVARNSSTTVALPVTFDDVLTTNQDNCKGARFTYSFTAQARQA